MQLLTIADLKLRPFVRVVAEPLAKFRAWRDVLEPEIHMGSLFGKATRPQPVDKYAHSVCGAGFFIDPLDCNSQGRSSSTHASSLSRNFAQVVSEPILGISRFVEAVL